MTAAPGRVYRSSVTHAPERGDHDSRASGQPPIGRASKLTSPCAATGSGPRSPRWLPPRVSGSMGARRPAGERACPSWRPARSRRPHGRLASEGSLRFAFSASELFEVTDGTVELLAKHGHGNSQTAYPPRFGRDGGSVGGDLQPGARDQCAITLVWLEFDHRVNKSVSEFGRSPKPLQQGRKLTNAFRGPNMNLVSRGGCRVWHCQRLPEVLHNSLQTADLRIKAQTSR
jgi:hypothetical protein